MTEEIKTETTQTCLPVASISIRNGDQSIIFDPKDDITPKEVALTFQMFLNAIMLKGENMLDFGTFISAHKLERHFTEVQNESKEG